MYEFEFLSGKTTVRIFENTTHDAVEMCQKLLDGRNEVIELISINERS